MIMCIVRLKLLVQLSIGEKNQHYSYSTSSIFFKLVNDKTEIKSKIIVNIN